MRAAKKKANFESQLGNLKADFESQKADFKSQLESQNAGITTLNILSKPGTYDRLEGMASRLTEALSSAAKAAKVPLTINRVGSLMTAFFANGPVNGWADVANTNKDRYSTFFHHMLEGGVYLAPSAFEAAFVSTAHTHEDIDRTVAVAESAFGKL